MSRLFATISLLLLRQAHGGAETLQQLGQLATARRECEHYLQEYEFTSRPDAYAEISLAVFQGCLEELRGRSSRTRRTFVGGVHHPTMVTRHPGTPPVLASGMAEMLRCDEEPDYRARCCGGGQPPCWSGDAALEVRCCGPPPGPSFIFVTPALDVNVGSRLRNQGTFVVQQSYAMQSLLEPGDVVVDAGANLGAYTVPFAAQVGPAGRVHAFEPFRKIFQLLCANVAVNGLGNVHTYQAALGAAEERLQVRAPDLATFNLPSSMQVRNQGYSQAERNWTLFYEGASEDVSVMALDSLRLESLKLLKIDVEDMEAEVVVGARETLARLRPWVWAENAQLFEHGDQSFLEAMASVGYQCEQVAGMEWELLCGFRGAA